MRLLLGGVDEAGRGPLAGPVVAAAVVVHAGKEIAGVDDSKRLSPSRREELAPIIQSQAVDFAIALASVAEIDELNILHATMLAMRRAVQSLRVVPQQLRIDGNRVPALSDPWAAIAEALVGGDGLCPAIGAASILAKVERDRIMIQLDELYPEYGFAQHKGYPTRFHTEALQRHGVTPEHPRSYAPVRRAARQISQSAVHE